MSKIKVRICNVCNCEIKTSFSDNERKGIAIHEEDISVCHDCGAEGWSICRFDKKIFNTTEVNEEFELIPEVSQKQVPVQLGIIRFCSNKCYNLYHLDYELNEPNSVIMKIKLLGLYDENTDEEKRLMLQDAEKRIEYLNNLKKQFMN